MEKLLVALFAFIFGFFGFLFQKIIDKLYFERLNEFNKLRGDISKTLLQIFSQSMSNYNITASVEEKEEIIHKPNFTDSQRREITNDLFKHIKELGAFVITRDVNWFFRLFQFSPKTNFYDVYSHLLVVASHFDNNQLGVSEMSDVIERINILRDNLKINPPKKSDIDLVE